MANTVIALKKSGTSSATPASLVNGELAINYADGKLFYKAANGTILSISGTSANAFSTVNADGTLIVSDSPSSILTLLTANGITIAGDSVNDRVTIGLNVSGLGIAPAFDRANSAQTIAIAAFSTANAAVSTTTLNGANTAIGTGANTVGSAAFAKANAAVTATTLNGANTAIGTGANTVGSAAFAQANAAFSRANSSNALIYADSVSASRYLTFTDSVSGTLDRANIGYGLTFNPSSNQMTISHATVGPRLTLTQTGSSAQPSYLIFNRTTATSGAFYGVIQWSTTASDSSNTMISSIQASGSTIMPSQRQTLTYSAFTDHRFQVGTGSGNTQFANASVEVVRIDNSGNVGIGIAAPTSKLHVVGAGNISTTLTVAGYDVVTTMGAAFDKANTANLYAFFVDSNTIAAFDRANSAQTIAIAAFTTANSAGGADVGAAFDRANSAQTIAIAAFSAANSAGGADVAAAFDRANSAQTIAIAAFAQANTGGGGSINTASIVVFSNTRNSTNANSGAVIIAGGLGVSGNIYTANRIGYSNTTNLSVVYTFYNSTTLSLDTVFE